MLGVVKFNCVIDIFHMRLQEIIMYHICEHNVIINYENVCRVSIMISSHQSRATKESALGYKEVH